ncbi:unnamed protein product [Caenorhabditis brenneri]
MEFKKFTQPKLAKLELLVKFRDPVGENIKHEFLRKAIVLNFLEIDKRHGLTDNDLIEEIGKTKNYVASDDQTWIFVRLRVLGATRTAVTAQLLSQAEHNFKEAKDEHNIIIPYRRIGSKTKISGEEPEHSKSSNGEQNSTKVDTIQKHFLVNLPTPESKGTEDLVHEKSIQCGDGYGIYNFFLMHNLQPLLTPQSTGGEIGLYFVEKGVHKFLYQGRVKEYIHNMEEIIEKDVGNVDKTEEEEEIQESKENEEDTEESNEKLNVLDHVLNISERVLFSIADSSSNPFINALLGIAGSLEDAPRMHVSQTPISADSELGKKERGRGQGRRKDMKEIKKIRKSKLPGKLRKFPFLKFRG